MATSNAAASSETAADDVDTDADSIDNFVNSVVSVNTSWTHYLSFTMFLRQLRCQKVLSHSFPH